MTTPQDFQSKTHTREPGCEPCDRDVQNGLAKAVESTDPAEPSANPTRSIATALRRRITPATRSLTNVQVSNIGASHISQPDFPVDECIQIPVQSSTHRSPFETRGFTHTFQSSQSASPLPSQFTSQFTSPLPSRSSQFASPLPSQSSPPTQLSNTSLSTQPMKTKRRRLACQRLGNIGTGTEEEDADDTDEDDYSSDEDDDEDDEDDDDVYHHYTI